MAPKASSKSRQVWGRRQVQKKGKEKERVTRALATWSTDKQVRRKCLSPKLPYGQGEGDWRTGLGASRWTEGEVEEREREKSGAYASR